MNTLKRYPLLVFYSVALLFAGLWEGLYVVYGAGNPLFSVMTLLLASYGPTVGTLVALTLLRDAQETRAWQRRLLTFRANWRWYVLAALLPASGWLAGTALTTLLGSRHFFLPKSPLRHQRTLGDGTERSKQSWCFAAEKAICLAIFAQKVTREGFFTG